MSSDVTSVRECLVEKLVTTLHLNVSERFSLGPEPLRRNEISELVSRVLVATGFFPAAARPWSKGKTVYEGHILERLPNGTIRLWAQRPHAIEPYRLAEQNHRDFAKLHEAIDSFIEREWPDHTIDGISFVNG